MMDLQLIKLFVDSILSQKFLMCSALSDLSLMHNHYAVSMLNCPEDMKDTLGEQCKLRLGELQAAMLMTQIGRAHV